MDAEGRVLLGEPREGERHLLLVRLRLGLDGDLDDRLGELDGLEDDRLLRIAKGIAGERLLQTDRGGDVAGGDLVHLLTMVRVHEEDARDPLLAVLRRAEDGVAGSEYARVDAKERELPDEGVAHDLERERAEGIVRSEERRVGKECKSRWEREH